MMVTVYGLLNLIWVATGTFEPDHTGKRIFWMIITIGTKLLNDDLKVSK